MNHHHSIERVAVLSVHTCPLAMLGGKKTGGMNVYVRDYCRELGRRGIEVDVFTRSQDSCVPKVVHDLGENARVIHIPAGPEQPLPVPQVAEYLDQFTAGVLDYARRKGVTYDVIHSHYWLSGLVAGSLRESWGDAVPIIHMFHTLGHMKNLIARDDFTRAPQSRIDGEMRVIHEIADQIVAATPTDKQQLLDLYDANPAKITVIPPGVDLDRFAPVQQMEARRRIGLDGCKRNILFVGRIEPLKGIDTLLKAVGKLRESCPEILENVCVTIVGGDPKADSLDDEMARLQSMCAALELDDLVTFVGSKDQMVLPLFYAAADMVVMPSHYESFGMVALEAMAMGTPVIASEVGGLAHLVKDGVTGFHVPSRNADALAMRIFALLNDPAQRQQMGECAADYARMYAWSEIVDLGLDLYEGLLVDSADSNNSQRVEITPHFSFQAPATLPCAIA